MNSYIVRNSKGCTQQDVTKNYSKNLTFPFIVGAAFGFGWTPCIGPILGAILTLAAIEENYSPQNMLDTELVHLLSKLNELRLSDKVSN